MTYVYTIIYPIGLLDAKNTIYLCCGRSSDDIAIEIRNGAFSLVTANMNKVDVKANTNVSLYGK